MNYYLLIPLFFALILFLTEKKSFTLPALIFSILIISLVSGFRFEVGRDFDIYEDLFQGKLAVGGLDFLFVIFSVQTSTLDPTGRLGFVLTAFMIITGYLLFINKHSLDNRLSLLIFLCVPVFFFGSLNFVRQHLSIALGLLAILAYTRKKSFSLILIILSSLLHQGGVLFFLIYFQRFMNRQIFIYLGGGMMILLPLFFLAGGESIILSNFQSLSYFKNHSSENSPYLALVFFFLNLIIFTSYIRSYPKDKIGRIISIFIIVSSVTIPLWMVSEFANLWLRIATFANFHLLLSLPYFLNTLRPLHYKALVTNLCIFILSFIYLFYWYSDPSLGYESLTQL